MKKKHSLMMLAALASVSAMASPSGLEMNGFVKKIGDGDKRLSITNDTGALGGGTGMANSPASAVSQDLDYKDFGTNSKQLGLGDVTAGGKAKTGGAGATTTT